MKFKIVGDSCTDFTPEDMKKEYVVSVPLTIDIGGYEIVDDETFDQADFLRRVSAYDGSPKSACPSPELYMESFAGASQVFVVTLSSHLSGSYNSARLAKQMYEEEHPDVKIHVFDSRSAAAGQVLLAKQIENYALKGMEFDTLVEKVSKFRDCMQTAFVLESLDTLRKNGRLTGVKALVASALNIKPLMKGVDGVIQQAGQARGINKALDKMVDYVSTTGSEFSDKTLVIAQCNCPKRAEHVKKRMLEKYHFKDCIVTDTKGISSLYANDGGIVIAY